MTNRIDMQRDNGFRNTVQGFRGSGQVLAIGFMVEV